MRAKARHLTTQHPHILAAAVLTFPSSALRLLLLLLQSGEQWGLGCRREEGRLLGKTDVPRSLPSPFRLLAHSPAPSCLPNPVSNH